MFPGHCLCATSEKRFWRWSLHEEKLGPGGQAKNPNYTGEFCCKKLPPKQVFFVSGIRGTCFLFYHLRASKCFWRGTFDGRIPMQCLNVKKTPGFIPWDFLFSTPQDFDGIFFQQVDVCLDIFRGWNFSWSFPWTLRFNVWVLLVGTCLAVLCFISWGCVAFTFTSLYFTISGG